MTTDAARAAPRVVLASQSRSRQRMLEAAGVRFEAIVSGVDEVGLLRELEALGRPAPEAVARALAAAKAEAVSQRHPEAIVIGADQVLALGERMLDKPADLAAARRQLMEMRGREHELISAVVVAQAGRVGWSHAERAVMTMRHFSEAFLDGYLAVAGMDVCQSVGAYQLEGLGAQLFQRIEGDYFTILGMPLVALLEELRAREVLVT